MAVKPSRYNRSKNICCSKQCASLLQKETYKGDGNHQFGLVGPLNASFKTDNLQDQNGKNIDIMVYSPDCPESNKAGRVKKHRLLIYQNKNRFNKCLFKNDLIHPDINIHHIDCDHDHNNIDNLVPLTKKQHKSLHTKLGYAATEILTKIIGVVKQGELLESPEEDNQQPSLYGNIFDGSETNSRIQLDSNADTSALLQ